MSASRFEPDRLAEMLSSAGAAARPRLDCPSADQIWAALHLEVPPGERERIIDHTTECPVCAEAWQLAMEIERADATRVKPVTQFAWRDHVPTWARIAAAVLVLAVGGVLVARWRQPGERPQVRDGATPAIRSLVPEGAALPRDGFVLRWAGGPDGARYDVVVTTPGLDVIADVRDLERPEYRVDPARLASLASGTRLLWRVVAHAPDGSTVSSATAAAILQD